MFSKLNFLNSRIGKKAPEYSNEKFYLIKRLRVRPQQHFPVKLLLLSWQKIASKTVCLFFKSVFLLPPVHIATLR